MQSLIEPDNRRCWDLVVCVSGWQRKQLMKHLGLGAEKSVVLRNAMAPAFENLFASRDALAQAKSGPLRLAYTSTPFRGLDILLEVFPSFRARRPGATLDVYSSMAVYQTPNDPHQDLYRKARSLAGVNYAGSIPQVALAGALSKAHILSYPNTFPETSCIAVMEALGAGLRVVTSELGALPETTGGHARLVPMGKNRDDYVGRFRKALQAPYAIESEADRAYGQVVEMNRTSTWRVRAREWTETLARHLDARA
jgi:glycosyltransferase involved in cell wall biosynthesis